MSALLSACSSGGAKLTPPARALTPAGKMTATTFTIKWTNPTASAALRSKSTISPSAQSVSITVNGKLTAVANRNGSPTQSVAIDAPVGIDAFVFSVFDQVNAAGHLLGTATVTQQIVDGAANAVSASIVATCAATNVTYANDDPLSIHKNAPGGVFSQILQSILLVGQSPATLNVAPQDADGNVIITGTGGAVSGTVTVSATVTSIDGAHVLLTPLTGSRTTVPDTLTISAPGCPPALVAVQHSPAIYAQTADYNVTIDDWFGDTISSVTIATHDAVIGYDERRKKIVTYNSVTGQVSEYAPDLTSSSPLYIISTNNYVVWSNYLDSVFGATSSFSFPSFHISFYTVAGGFETPIASVSSMTNVKSVAAASYSTGATAFGSDFGTNIYEFNLAAFGAPSSVLANGGFANSLAMDDSANILYGFINSGMYVDKFALPLPSTVTASNDGLTANPDKGAVDTDDHDIYAFVGGMFEASSSTGATLSGFPQNLGPGIAIVVVSANEH